MSTTIDDQVPGPPDDLFGESDEEVLVRCREIEFRRRADLADHVRVLREVERRKLYYADGHRDLAGFGRAEYRWADRDAKAHRDLQRLCVHCPQLLDQLSIGRVGTAQAFLLARLSRAPRVGVYVVDQINDFVEYAARLSFLQFEQYVIAWKCLMDQDGPDPERAHRDRNASLTHTGLYGRFCADGPAIDHAQLKALMTHFEQVEFDRDWATATLLWGDEVCADKLARTGSQRRYDAFQNLLQHVHLPTLTDPDLQTDPDQNDSDPDPDETSPDIDSEGAAPAEVVQPVKPVNPVEAVVAIVIDGDSFLHGLEQLLGTTAFRPVRTPFGPGRAFCHTFDGDPIALRDTVLAAIAGKVRIVLQGPNGIPIAMTSASRLFTGALRDAVLMTATHCTHPGCNVPATRCQIDHIRPHHQGGITNIHNGAVACGHHNRWRHAAQVKVVRLTDGTIATYRPNGTPIALPT